MASSLVFLQVYEPVRTNHSSSLIARIIPSTDIPSSLHVKQTPSFHFTRKFAATLGNRIRKFAGLSRIYCQRPYSQVIQQYFRTLRLQRSLVSVLLTSTYKSQRLNIQELEWCLIFVGVHATAGGVYRPLTQLKLCGLQQVFRCRTGPPLPVLGLSQHLRFQRFFISFVFIQSEVLVYRPCACFCIWLAIETS